MTIFSDTQTFPQTKGVYPADARSALLIVSANGGSVSVSALMSDDTSVIIEDGTFSTDIAVRLNIHNGRFRVTPTGGATYQWFA